MRRNGVAPKYIAKRLTHFLMPRAKAARWEKMPGAGHRAYEFVQIT